jgi:hypothetical protein
MVSLPQPLTKTHHHSAEPEIQVVDFVGSIPEHNSITECYKFGVLTCRRQGFEEFVYVSGCKSEPVHYGALIWLLPLDQSILLTDRFDLSLVASLDSARKHVIKIWSWCYSVSNTPNSVLQDYSPKWLCCAYQDLQTDAKSYRALYSKLLAPVFGVCFHCITDATITDFSNLPIFNSDARAAHV